MTDAMIALANRIDGPSAGLVLVVLIFVMLEIIRMRAMVTLIRENTKALGRATQVLSELLQASPKIVDRAQVVLLKLEERLDRLGAK